VVVGRVAALRRYPVKSMQGLEVDRLAVGPAGVEGDRRRACIDEETGRIMSAKRFGRLLEAAADDEGITLPDGCRLRYGDEGMDEALSAWLGRPVRLEERSPDTQRSYEMTLEPPNDDAEYYEIPSPPGSYLDLAGVHLLSLATLAAGEAASADLDWDVRRFRPNIVVDGVAEAFGEDTWCGSTVTVGSARLAARQPTVRCAMPLRAQPGLDRQPRLFEALTALHDNHLGTYLDVVFPGEVRVGDEVTVDVD
jgi:uncharacterized protein YcbX